MEPTSIANITSEERDIISRGLKLLILKELKAINKGLEVLPIIED